MTRRSSAARRLRLLWDELRAGDPLAVHEARKLTRRAGAELRVTGAGGRVRRAWRDLRRAAAPLRDHDVSGGHLRAALLDLGAPASTLSRFDRTWAARREALLTQTVWPERPPAFDLERGWKGRARRLAARDAPDLLRGGAAALASEDLPAWHDWRKRLKRHRYTLDLLGEVPEALKDTLEALGRLQDAEVLLERLRAEPGLLRAYRPRLIAREEAARRAAQQQVRALFPALARHLEPEAFRD